MMRKAVLKSVPSIGVIFLTLCSSGYSEETPDPDSYTNIRMNFRAQGAYNDISGPGRASSSLSEGWNDTEELNFTIDGKEGEFKYNFSAGGRATNDDSVDSIPVSLTSLQGRFEYKESTVGIGDIFESYSQYSLSSSLKGLTYRYKNNNYDTYLPEISVIYGKAYPRWESWWKDKDAQSIDRNVYGANIRYDVVENLELGATFLRSEDSDRQNASDTLYDNNVTAFTLGYEPITNLNILSEIAFSSTEKEEQEGQSRIPENGMAFKIEAIGDQNPSRVSLKYERVDEDFETLLGSAIRDRETASAKWRYKYGKDWVFNNNFTWYRTGLADDANSTTNYKPEFKVTKRRFMERKYAVANLNLKYDIKNREINDTDNYFIDLGYRDRFYVFDIDTGVGVSSYKTTNDTTDSMDYTANFNISSRHSFETVVLKPSLRASSSYMDDDELNETNKIYEYSLGLGLDVPDHNITSSFRFGQNMLESESGDDADSLFVNMSVYYHPEFLQGGNFYARVIANDFSFQTSNRDYKEKSVIFGIEIPLEFTL